MAWQHRTTKLTARLISNDKLLCTSVLVDHVFVQYCMLCALVVYERVESCC